MNTFKIKLTKSMFAIVAAAVALPASAADTTAEVQSIRHLMMATFDKPDARLIVDPVVVVGANAVAGWTQGERGGRALLARQGSEWQITLCAGDGLKEPKVLRETGISSVDAHSLVEGLATAEARLPAAQRAKFSTFDGVVRMDASGQHPPEHKH